MTHEVRWLDQVYTDTRLSARDKAVYTLMFLRRDVTQEYRLGLNAVRHQLGLRWETVKHSVDRLIESGYCVPIQTARPVSYHLPVPDPAQPAPLPLPPTDAPRMAMPHTLATEIVWWLGYARRMVEAAATADMAGITPDQRTQWIAQADQLDAMMDTFARWLTRFGGGMDVKITALFDSSSDSRD